MSGTTLWTNAALSDAGSGPAGLHEIAVAEGRILAVAQAGSLDRAGATLRDCAGRLVTPAFIDCHTHLVHGGDRTREFEMRLEGADYAAIARAGGGIAATMRATRGLGVEGLVAAALPRLDALLREGVATVEIKSGYGLEVATELDMLRAARRLSALRPVRVRTSWLAAHAVPPDHGGSRDDYIRDVAIAGLEQAHAEGLVDAVDAFCETIAFSAEEIAPLFARARALGLPVRVHAEQLSHAGGTRLAARHGALSADHLEYATEADVAALRAAGSVAVLLPGAFYMLRQTRMPPVAALRAAGVPMALATDANPGTSPIFSLLLAMNMGAVLFGMTVAECLDGVTGHAARALGLGDVTGRLAPGLAADLAVWDVERPAQLVGRVGIAPLHCRVFGGIADDD